ncbi:MAG: outer membrane protein assembly factor BamA [Candidatus Cloacimonetes bacterium]|nr:outer membrane protein assembly factor BamA [Candidatus Cloacimonadota bacterium]
MSNIRKVIFLIIMVSFTMMSAENGIILKSIKFEGNKAISAGVLKKNLNLKAENLGNRFFFWKAKPYFNEIFLEEDIKQIKVLYQRAGFLGVEVKAKTEADAKNRKTILTFEIKENDPVIIKIINYAVEALRTEDRELVKKLLDDNSAEFNARAGSRFQDDNINNTIKQINLLLMNNGFPEPETEFEIELIDQNRFAEVNYKINTGEYCYFGEIRVQGNEKLAEKVILKQVSFNEQDSFDQRKIQKTQQRIQNLGMFQFVTMKTMLTEIEDNKIPVEIIVKELPYWSVKTGVGYGLEDRFRLSVRVEKLGFLGGARRASFFAKYSYLEPYHLSVVITQPSFINPQGSLSISPFLIKEHEESYDLQKYGFSTTMLQNLSNAINTFIKYKFERDNLQINSDITDELLYLSQENYNKSSISAGISIDDSHPLFSPVQGYAASFVTTLSGLKLGSEYHYLQGLIDLRKYNEISEGSVVAGKVKAGIMKPVWGDNTTPIDERFFAGGSNSIRGWARGKVGPQSEEGIALGGESYLEFSLELRQLLWRMLSGVLFCDAGNVWSGYDDYDLGGLKYSAGLGIRITTPIGPIRFDAAQPLWSEDKQIQLHLNIGQAF